MANFLLHTSCPNCGSKDNRGLYDDGSSWCFGCGYFTRPTVARPFIPKSTKQVRPLPSDAETILPVHAEGWLKTYGITKEERVVYGIMYSKQKELLIFPDFDAKGQVIMWQGRYFGQNKDHPKYLTYGNKDHITICDDNKDPEGMPSFDMVCIVEDKVSAIKVGRLIPAVPLYGSTLSLEHARRLGKTFKQAYLWLDHDKFRESLKQARMLSHLFPHGIHVKTKDLDPKAYDLKTIGQVLDLI